VICCENNIFPISIISEMLNANKTRTSCHRPYGTRVVERFSSSRDCYYATSSSSISCAV